MNDRPCAGCIYHKVVHVIAYAGDRDRCFRPRTMADGTMVECGKNGFDAPTERDRIPEPQRKPNDKCGPTGQWWGSEL